MKGKARALDPAVTELLRSKRHPLEKEIDEVRRIVLGVSPDIAEVVKWNAPSFRTATADFATVNLRATDGVQLVFHLGAKVKDNTTGGVKLPDPEGLVKWLAKERCLVTLGRGAEIAARRKAFEAIVREWIRHCPLAS